MIPLHPASRHSDTRAAIVSVVDKPFEGEFRVTGEWWLPGAADHKVTGILRFSQEDGGELELIGSLRGLMEHCEPSDGSGARHVTEVSLKHSGSYGRIVGVAGGKSWTLEGCFRIHNSNLFAARPGTVTELIHVNRALRGAEFEKDESLDATCVTFRLLHLVYWVDQGGFAERHYFPGKAPPGEPILTIDHSRTELPEVELPHGMRLRLREVVSLAGDRIADRSVQRDFSADIEGERQDISAYLEVAGDLQDLVSMGTDRTASFEALSFFHPDITRKLRDYAYQMPIDFLAQWATGETRRPEPLLSHDLLFTLPQLGGTDFLPRWFRVAERYRLSLGRVMGTRYRSRMFASDRLLNRAAALEAFNRSRSGSMDSRFRTRMERLANSAGPLFAALVGDVHTWSTRFKAIRDTIAHNSDQPVDEAEVDHYLGDAAYYLFLICLLREAEAPDEVFDRIDGNAAFRGCGRRLRELL